jgi:hypothetical protein
LSAEGKPEKVSEYPKMTLSMPRRTKARLEAVSMLKGLPAWRIVDEAVTAFVAGLPTEDRSAIEALVRRMEAA